MSIFVPIIFNICHQWSKVVNIGIFKSTSHHVQFLNSQQLFYCIIPQKIPGRLAQLVTCLATDASLTADPGVASSIPARSHIFVEIDHEIISTVILLPSTESLKKGCCQLQAKVCAGSTG